MQYGHLATSDLLATIASQQWGSSGVPKGQTHEHFLLLQGLILYCLSVCFCHGRIAPVALHPAD